MRKTESTNRNNQSQEPHLVREPLPLLPPAAIEIGLDSASGINGPLPLDENSGRLGVTLSPPSVDNALSPSNIADCAGRAVCGDVAGAKATGAPMLPATVAAL